MIRSARLIPVLALMIAAAVGCQKGSKHAPAAVSGQVMYKGEALTAGSVAFHSEKDGTYNVPIKSDGTFSSKDIPIGAMKVTVETESANPGNVDASKKYQPKGGGKGASTSPDPRGPGAATSAGKYVKIPDKYTKKDKTDLSATLVAGANDGLKFELKD